MAAEVVFNTQLAAADGRVCRLWLLLSQLHPEIIRVPAVNASLLSLGLKRDAQPLTC